MNETALTVLIPCKDEQKNIRACIESARPIADEILIADSGSTDQTLEIVKRIGGCRVIEREYIHSGDFKNWAIPQATHNWVLLLDADERVTPQLGDEIRETLNHSGNRLGYWIYRANHFMGHPVRHGVWSSDKVLRLFRRDQARYVGDNDHAEIVLPPSLVGFLRARITHYSYWSYDEYFQRFHRYTTYQATNWQRAGKQPSRWQMLLRVPSRFLYSYIARRGFLDGLPGLQVAMLDGFYSFMKQARLWELTSARQQAIIEETSEQRNSVESKAKQRAA